VLLSILLSGPAPPASVAAERASVAAGRVASGIRVDGILDEPEWSAARPIRDFRLIFRREGEAPSESTEVRVLFDDGRIYFGVRCENRGPGPVRASLVPRDQVTDGDFVAIHLDTYRDRRRAYVFGVNPYGVQLDGILDGDEPDFSWDAVWDAETTRDPFGWTAEIAVPLRSIRYPRGGDGTWGLWIRREITKNDEVCSWPLWRQSVQGDIMLQAADLTGMTGLRGGGRLEAEPYVSSITNRTSAYSRLTPSPGGPSILDLFRSQHTTTDVGGDLRYPLTSTLVANATINPDFSQIEADAIQIDVNRRYPLFYSEKRPFFLEGAELFTTPLGLVYTRRFADPSVGGKLTGKQGRVSLGMILLRDEDGASAEGVGGGGGGFLRPGQFHVARVAYDAGENSRLGVLAAYHRSDDRSGGIVPAVIPAAPLAQGGGNTVLAADARLRLASRVFFNGQLAWSRTRVDSSSDVRGRDIVAHSTVTDAAISATRADSSRASTCAGAASTRAGSCAPRIAGCARGSRSSMAT
jgi:hypothetical protein